MKKPQEQRLSKCCKAPTALEPRNNSTFMLRCRTCSKPTVSIVTDYGVNELKYKAKESPA